MQESFVFSDTIANNIAVSDEIPDMKRIRRAVEIANIGEFIESLPLGITPVSEPTDTVEYGSETTPIDCPCRL